MHELALRARKYSVSAGTGGRSEGRHCELNFVRSVPAPPGIACTTCRHHALPRAWRVACRLIDMEVSQVVSSARHAWCMLCASTLVLAAVGVLLSAQSSVRSSSPRLLIAARHMLSVTLQEPNGCRMSYSYPSFSRLELPAELKCVCTCQRICSFSRAQQRGWPVRSVRIPRGVWRGYASPHLAHALSLN